MGFLDKVTGAVLVGVFVLALMMFGYSAQIENDVNDTILDDPHFAGVNDTFATTLDDVRDDAETERINFEGLPPESGADEGFGILTVPSNVKKFTSMLFASFKLVTNLIEDVFGVPPVVFNVLGGLLLIIMVVLGWSVLKGART